MPPLLVNQVRVEQTRRQLLSLSDEITDWFSARRLKDKKQQHHSQLVVLEGVLGRALNRIRVALDAVTSSVASGDLYPTCRMFDQRVGWVRRIWEYFREKFDQRDEAVLGPILAAADEVVWSCYADVFKRASALDPDIKQGSVPLPYIDLGYSPHAIPRAEPPPGLKSNVDAPFLREYLTELPIPIIALPVSCVQDPWWLVTIGHEVGHHVQYDLYPDWQLIDVFAKGIKVAVTGDQPTAESEARAQRWETWGREIFADYFSVLCMGPWALWAINELELANDQAMITNKTLYPSAVARLALMHQFIRSLGLDATVIDQFVKGLTRLGEVRLSLLSLEQLHRISLAGENGQPAATAFDVKVASDVAHSLVELNLGKCGSLRDVMAWEKDEHAPYQTVFKLASQLLQPGAPQPLRTLRGARLFTSAAVAAWAAVSTEPDNLRRQERRAALARNTLLSISASREEGTRAASKTKSESEIHEMGDKLGALLMQSTASQLEPSTPETSN